MVYLFHSVLGILTHIISHIISKLNVIIIEELNK